MVHLCLYHKAREVSDTRIWEADLCGVFHFKSDLLKVAEHKLFVHRKTQKMNSSAGSLDAGTRFGNKHFENT